MTKSGTTAGLETMVLHSNARICLKERAFQSEIECSHSYYQFCSKCCKIGAASSTVAAKMQDVESRQMPGEFAPTKGQGMRFCGGPEHHG